MVREKEHEPQSSVEARIVAFEDTISHNSRTECAKKSVKTSSDAEDSNEKQRILGMLRVLMRSWGRIFCGKHVCAGAQKLVLLFKQLEAKTKQVGNKRFYIKHVNHYNNLEIIIEKKFTFPLGVKRFEIPNFGGVFTFFVFETSIVPI